MKLTKNNVNFKKYGFTIVELLVVIVVIGILASITIVSYTGITQKAVVSTIKSDLANNAKKLKMYYTLYGSYPTALDGSNCPSAPTADANYCLVKSSSSNTLSYSSVAPSTFRISISDSTNNYYQTDSSIPSLAATVNGATTGNPCPTNYIPVPGSGTYGTSDFCVMKYEAKILGNDVGAQTYSAAFVPDSRMTGTPWVNISQTDAITESATACTGCHLITEPEWLTIAQNVLSVASNWDNGAGVHTVGTGYIYSGHNDGTPANSLAAAVDGDPYNSTGQSSPSNQKRTLTLTNGEVIWDMAGNVWDWTNSTIASGQQPGLVGESSFAWKQWNNALLVMNGLSTISNPSSTGISGIAWNSSAGVGQLYSNYGNTFTQGFLHGGHWSSVGGAGVSALDLGTSPSSAAAYIGFRVSR